MFETAMKVFARRNIDFNEMEQKILTHIFELTVKYRRF
jgi:hypothetical protein